MRSRTRQVSVVFFVLLALIGCDEADDVADGDAMNLSIVWGLSSEPVVMIGDESRHETTFDGITGVHLDSGGRIWVVDGRSAEVRVFRSDGAYLETWGGRGGGPGEYTAPRLLGAIRGDSLVILDQMDQVVSVLAPGGEPGWSARLLTAEEPTPRQALSALSDGRVVFYDVTLFLGDLDEGEVLSDTVMLSVFDPHVGSVSQLGHAAVPMWVWFQGEQVPMPFSPQFSLTTRGDTVFTLGPSGSTVLVYTIGGGSTSWSSARMPERVKRSDHAEYRRSVDGRGLSREVSSLWKDALNHPDLPKLKPMYDRLVATDDGELWARRASYEEGQPSGWDVFSAEGVVRGMAFTRRDFQVKQVTADRVVGVIRDSLGVQTVAVFEKRARRDSARAALAVEQVREELDTLSELQQIYFADHMKYAARLDALRRLPPVRHPEVAIRIVSADGRGWAVSATHTDLGPGEGCTLFWGNPASLPSDPIVPERAEEIACTLQHLSPR